MQDKVSFLLNEFPDTEWSGPAWYEIMKSDGDFPEKVMLVYFKPIDLGDSTSTELDGEELGKLLPDLYKDKPELKDCALGLIHSHHTLGAFFSQTDKDTALDNASATGLYFSTVVASEKTKCVFGFSYEDRLGFNHFVEGDVYKPKEKIVINPEWKKEAKSIAKKAKEKKKSYFGSFNYKYYNGESSQRTMFDSYLSPASKLLNADIVEEEDEEDMILTAIDAFIINRNFNQFASDIRAINSGLDASNVLKEYYKENSINSLRI